MSDQKTNPDNGGTQTLITWILMAGIAAYIVALNVLAFTTVFGQK